MTYEYVRISRTERGDVDLSSLHAANHRHMILAISGGHLEAFKTNLRQETDLACSSEGCGTGSRPTCDESPILHQHLAARIELQLKPELTAATCHPSSPQAPNPCNRPTRQDRTGNTMPQSPLFQTSVV